MKVWYIHPYAGGPSVGRYWRPLLLGRAWTSMGHKTTVITSRYHHLLDSDAEVNDRIIDGCEYKFLFTTKYKKNNWGRIFSMLLFAISLLTWGIWQVIKGSRPDVIIYSSPHPFGFPSAFFVSRISKAKLIFEVRDIWPLSAVQLASFDERSFGVKFTKILERFCYRVADSIVSLLPSFSKYLEGEQLKTGNVYYVPNGVSINDCFHTVVDNEVVSTVREQQKNGCRVMVYAGAHGKPNNLALLLQAISLLSEQQQALLSIIFIGKGDEKEALKDAAKQIARAKVFFFDQMDRQSVLSALQTCDFGYVSLQNGMLFSFGVSPNKVWDYMSQRLPILFSCSASDNPVSAAHCGIVVSATEPNEVADGLSHFVSAPREKLEAMAENGWEYVLAHATYDRLADTYAKVFSTL